MRTLRLFVFTLFIASVFCVPTAFGAGGFTVSPMFQEITLTEAGQTEFSVTVENLTQTIATFHLSVLDFGSLDESGGVAFLGGTKDLEKKYSLASWMQPEADTLTLAPGATQNVKVRIENRDDLSPGGHYAALILKNTADPQPESLQNGIAVNEIFSVLVFVKKVGGEQYGLEYAGEDWPHSWYHFASKYVPRFQNTGNVHIVPRGILSVQDPKGTEVARGTVNEESGLLLPESYRQFPLTLKTTGFAWLPGWYHAKLGYRYDGKDDFTVRDERFFYFPLPAILGLAFLVVGGGIYGAKRKRNTGDKGQTVPQT